MTSQYWTVITWEWLWLATILEETDSASLLVATRMLARWAVVRRSDSVLMLVWKFWAARETSL